MNSSASPTACAIALTQDELKTLVGQAALQYVVPGDIVGVGTGSTVNKFIDALASIKDQIKGAVSSSVASTERLKALGIPVFDSNEVERLSVYIDGADEIDGHGNMVKGGGAALTREKIVAAQSERFVCIADESKLVEKLGRPGNTAVINRRPRVVRFCGAILSAFIRRLFTACSAATSHATPAPSPR